MTLFLYQDIVLIAAAEVEEDPEVTPACSDDVTRVDDWLPGNSQRVT